MSGYIGTQPVPQSTQTRETFTATASQTSFATGGYQAGYIDVFLNGVKLVDGTDFTATNGSDVVLTTGAASGDTLEVVAYTAFEAANVTGATDFTVTGSFTSRGIDDNATSTAMTLDTSGNLLVGATSSDSLNVGHGLNPNGFTYHTRDGGEVLRLNRKTSGGDIATFRKDSTTVGSIGVDAFDNYTVSSGRELILSTDRTVARSYVLGDAGTSNGVFYPVTDADSDLGQSGKRWKNLYLSGGVYLGGTGAANKLDDYEEGTWTPTLSTGSASFQNFTYTKIGRAVHLTGYMHTLSGWPTSGIQYISGLPFTGAGNFQMWQLWHSAGSGAPTGLQATSYLPSNSAQLSLRPEFGNPDDFDEFSVSLTYITNQ